MGYYDRHSDWPEQALNTVMRTIPNAKECVVFGQSMNSEYTTKCRMADKESIVISYNCINHLFYAWNAQLHNHIHKPNATQIKLTSKSFGLGVINENEIKTLYIYRNRYGYEKVAVIGELALYEFCLNFEFYLTPNPSDDNFQTPALCVANTNELGFINENQSDSEIDKSIRPREYTSRLKRDSTFRKRVLEEYDYRCVVCGCTERKILQAAHIFDVRYGNDDSTDNGVCLCANHHILYDSGLLSIDWENNTFSCSSESEQGMSWYLEAQKREFKLYR